MARVVLDRIREEQSGGGSDVAGISGKGDTNRAAAEKGKGDRVESVRTLVEGRGTVSVSPQVIMETPHAEEHSLIIPLPTCRPSCRSSDRSSCRCIKPH